MAEITRSTSAKEKQKQTNGAKLLFLEKKLSAVPSASECERFFGKRKIITWGHDNYYPQWLNYLYYNNSMHGGIINGKVHFTVSGGLKYTPDSTDSLDQANWELMYQNGISDFNLDDVAAQISRDFEIFNKFILKGFWNIDFTRVERLELIDAETARKIEDSNDLLVCEDFSDRNRVGYKVYQLLNLKLKGSKPVAGKVRSREFYIAFEIRPKQTIDKETGKLSKRNYPAPTYSGAIRSICTGIEIDEWQNAEIVNNFSLGTVLNLNNGIPRNKTDRDELKKEIRKAATGATNTGGIWVNFSNGKDREATIVTLNGNNLAGRYAEVDKGTQKNILRAHSCTVPILFGVKEEGSLGNQTELLTGYSIMNKNYFRNRRRDILSVFNFIGQKCNGLKGKIEFNEPTLDLPEEKMKEPAVMIQNGKFKEEVDKEKIDERFIKQFKFAGVSKTSRRILYSAPIGESDDLIEKFRKQEFAELPANQQQVLNLIGDGNDFNSIKKAMDINASELARIYSKLIEAEYIKPEGGLTRSGAKQVAISDISKMEILYSYEKRAGVEGPTIIPGSRELCRELINLDRLYTREEIDRISTVEGYDVFNYAGGWWNDNGVNKPKCRHGWFQNVVFKD
jgi:hypothetical protein